MTSINQKKFIPPQQLYDIYYSKEHSPQQKKAYLCYLLHYQKYNAGFTKEASKKLGYQEPLKNIDANYVRSISLVQYNELLKPWLDRKELNIQPLKNHSSNKSKNYSKPWTTTIEKLDNQ